MKVVLTREAREDLEGIADHIAADSPRRARSFVRELLEAGRGIGRAPRAYPVAPRYGGVEIRRRVHGAYLIFYRIDVGAVTILHILHGARDYDAPPFPEG